MGLLRSAAIIIITVFGAFAWAEVAIVKMRGFRLTVAVFMDALVVRTMMLPAFMALAGDWNWVPGIMKKKLKNKEQ